MRCCQGQAGYTACECRCSVQRTVVTQAHRNIIVTATAAWLESLCQWGRVVVVVHCSAAECDDYRSRRPTRDLHCPLTSDEGRRRQWMFSADDQWRLLHSPTHIDIYWLTKYVPLATGLCWVKMSTPSSYFHDSAHAVHIWCCVPCSWQEPVTAVADKPEKRTVSRLLYTKVIAQTDNC